KRVAFAARVRAGDPMLGLGVDRDSANATAAPIERRPHLDAMPLRRERRRRAGDARLETQHAGLGLMRIERVREARREEARRLDRPLRVEAESRDVEETLQHRLALDVAAG